MIDNEDIRDAVEACGLTYALVVNASELDTCIHTAMPADGSDLVVSFVDTNGAFVTDQVTGRTYEGRNMLLIFYSRNDLEDSRDAETEGASHEAQVATHKDNAAMVMAALSASGKFAPIATWSYSVHPFETTDVLNGLWVTFELKDIIGAC